jgi:uroporphyrinogen decarboxylase
MKPRDRVLAAIRRQQVDRVPWVPFVGCHAGKLLGVGAAEYLKSAELMTKGIVKAAELYKPDGIPVAFDLQIEAEAMGCQLAWADENPPAVATHPLAGGGALSSVKLPTLSDGRIALVMQAAADLRKRLPDVALYGLITGPFTLALHLMGTDIFMQMFDDQGAVDNLMAFCRGVCQTMAGGYLDAGCDVVAVVDPMTSQIGPDAFERFVTPHVSAVFDAVRARGAASSFFVCGHAQQNIEAMCRCRPDNISVDENIPLDFVRDTCLEHEVSFGGNLKLTTVLLLGKPEDARRDAAQCLQIGGRTGYVLAPGCDLPYATPPANVQAVVELLGQTYEQQVSAAMAQAPQSCDALDMSEYGQSDRVIVDIITLDSEACAPCQYMVEAVRKIAPEFEGVVVWREHKIKRAEGLQLMTSLMVRNVPTICIDGEIRFVSRIPARDELVAAIQARICAKLRRRIRTRSASLVVLGTGSQACQEALRSANRAIAELGFEVQTRLVTDEKVIASYGLLPSQLPAIVLTRHQVKSTREVPPAAIIKEWLKDLH